MSGLHFYPASHRYKLDGEWVPGVTTVIGVLDKPALPTWSAAEVAAFVHDNPDAVDALRVLGRDAMIRELKGVPWRKRDDAADRGKILHSYAEALVEGQEVDIPAEHLAVMQCAVAFMDDWHIRPVSVEQACASREHRHAGTWDLVADYTHPRTGEQGRAIFDWKSGKRIYASAAFQLNAYGHSEFHGLDGDEHPVADLGIQAAYGVHIADTGYAVHPLPYSRDVYEEFLVIRRAFDINKRAEGDWRVPGSGYVGAPVLDDTEEVA